MTREEQEIIYETTLKPPINKHLFKELLWKRVVKQLISNLGFDRDAEETGTKESLQMPVFVQLQKLCQLANKDTLLKSSKRQTSQYLTPFTAV